MGSSKDATSYNALSRNTPGSAGARPGIFYGWIVAAVSLLIIILLSGLHYTYGVFFKPLLLEFGWSRAVTAGAFSFYMFIYAISVPLAGLLTDKYGPRITVVACGVLMGAGYLLMSQVSAAWQLYAAFGLLVGLGYSSGYLAPVATVTRWFVEKRGLVLGIVLSGVGIGAMVLPPLINYVISSSGWRGAYMVVGLAIMAIIIPSALLLKRDPRDSGLLPYGVKATADERSPAAVRAAAASGHHGITLRQAVRMRLYWGVVALYALAMIGGQMVVVHMVPYGTDKGMSPAAAATLLTMWGGFGILGRMSVGMVSDRIGGRTSIAGCFALQALAMFWLMAAGGGWSLYAFAAVFGFAYGGSVPMFPVIAGELFGMQSIGAVFGGITGGAGIGSATGPLLAGLIFDRTGNYLLAFLTGAVILAAACALALVLRKATRPSGG